MKKILSILVCIIAISSCEKTKTFDEKMTESLNSYIKKSSSGDKFIQVETFEIIKKHTVKERKEKVTEDMLLKIRKMNENFPSADLLNQYEMEYDFLQNQTDETAIALYEVKFKVKKETLKDDKIPSDYKALVLNDKKLKVIFFSVYKEVSHH